ncbi:dynein light chain Tctex-type 5-like [Anopheles cruzii]|uniref:dynein light chain Tctex-type 5-like n=1 Tax=Anopheles cruzii TaxID=68878 RepID=UPI0022EC66D7|nr:dynein light chain Tctex-type 5-like [Anopheles cruzii]
MVRICYDVEKTKRLKKIGFAEPDNQPERESKKLSEKAYRKSTYPRESMAAIARKSSVFILSSLMGPAMSSLRGQRSLHDRTSMYMAPRFQNSYRLESKYPFNRTAMQSMMNNFLQVYLGDYKYSAKRAKRLAENLGEELRNQFKRCHFDRYRAVVLVTVGDKASQDLRCVARALWDPENDDCASFSYEAATFFVVASVWAIYCE